MLTKRQRNQIPLGIERFKTDHRARDLEEAERQVIELAMRWHDEPDGASWGELSSDLDYACVALATARDRIKEIPPIPAYVDGWGPDTYCRMCEFNPCSCQ